MYFLLIFSFLHFFLFGSINLEENIESFILETRKIEIPDHPYAFNPSIVKWQNQILMTFRDIPIPKNGINNHGSSTIGIIRLDENFNPISEPQILDLSKKKILRQEDARLVSVDEKLYLLYSDNQEDFISEGGFRMYASELEFNGKLFIVNEPIKFYQFEGENLHRREKNWVPFDYEGNLLLSYSICPHIVFFPLFSERKCETFSKHFKKIKWNFGEIRGGTPAIRLNDSRYLAFFHSCQEMSTKHSHEETMLHYFMGAYTFSSFPPFEITHISPKPIVGKNFYNGPVYKPYWKPVRVVFPCGIIIDNDFIWISYGRQDHEMWIVKIDKKELLNSLIKISD